MNVPDHIAVKRCGTCKVIKHIRDFHRDESAHDGLQGKCKVCQSTLAKVWRSKNKHRKRGYMLRHNHNMSLAEYEALVKQQKGLCAICHEPPSQKNAKEMLLHVDHDHATGAIRGLLCNTCNRALGLLHDSIEVCESALEYLRHNAAS